MSRRSADGGQTTKWLWALEGGAQVETVLMRYPDRVTVCVSTQAGCAMACQFCATGQSGFERQLTQGEIVEQIAVAMREAGPRRVSNIVFMGMGEPLANYDRVWGAIRRLHGDMGLSARHLTLSTVGIVPGIRRLATESLPVNLAVSLHAANDILRDELVPINRRYPLAVLAEACAQYVAASGRRLSIEWAMIAGVNDRTSDAEELAAFARPLAAHVNLIPLNPTPGTRSSGRQETMSVTFATSWQGWGSTPPSVSRVAPRSTLPVANWPRHPCRAGDRSSPAGAGCTAWLERTHGSAKRSGVVRPSLFWFLLLDGGIVALTKLAVSKTAYDKVRDMTGEHCRRARPSRPC